MGGGVGCGFEMRRARSADFERGGFDAVGSAGRRFDAGEFLVEKDSESREVSVESGMCRSEDVRVRDERWCGASTSEPIAVRARRRRGGTHGAGACGRRRRQVQCEFEVEVGGWATPVVRRQSTP